MGVHVGFLVLRRLSGDGMFKCDLHGHGRYAVVPKSAGFPHIGDGFIVGFFQFQGRSEDSFTGT